MVLGILHDFQYHPNFSTVLLGEKETKAGEHLVPQSHISYKAIRNNKTLFDCVGKECFETEEEEEEHKE